MGGERSLRGDTWEEVVNWRREKFERRYLGGERSLRGDNWEEVVNWEEKEV